MIGPNSMILVMTQCLIPEHLPIKTVCVKEFMTCGGKSSSGSLDLMLVMPIATRTGHICSIRVTIFVIKGNQVLLFS